MTWIAEMGTTLSKKYEQLMFADTEAMTEAESRFFESVSTHRHVVSIDVVIIGTPMDNREFHPRRVI